MADYSIIYGSYKIQWKVTDAIKMSRNFKVGRVTLRKVHFRPNSGIVRTNTKSRFIELTNGYNTICFLKHVLQHLCKLLGS